MSTNNEFERMRGDGVSSGWISRAARAPLNAMKKILPKSSLIDKSRPYFSGVSRFGISKIGSFYHDPFHTLLNLPWGTFIVVFFSTYIILYLVFAVVYWWQKQCVIDPDGPKFSHALWMSSRVASTLGFSTVYPNAECAFINFCVMIQVIASSLINFIMLGVVFARFSAPFKRASTVRFSKVAAVSRHPSGFWALTLRVANLRKHQILQPSVRLVATAVDSITPSFYHHEQLQIEDAYKQLTNLELGFPAYISHVITPDSYLYNLSLLEMDTRMMEILVFVDGIDAMTSKFMSARLTYSTSDIYMNETFAPMNLQKRGRSVGLDFGDFDKTVPAMDPDLLLDGMEAAAYRGATPTEGLWLLRHQTFKKLAERYAHLGSTNQPINQESDAGNRGGSTSPTGFAHVTPETPHNQSTSLLPPHAAPSHMPNVKGMSLSTSGMPYAVARATGQEKDSGLLGLGLLGLGTPKEKGMPTGGAWLKAHSEAHQAPEEGTSGGGAKPTQNGSEKDSFIAMTDFQRNNNGPTGSAWQQSGGPQLGSPPVGSSGQADASSSTAPGVTGVCNARMDVQE